MTTTQIGPPTGTFGPYLLRGLIGRGGMGVVHRAVDTSHNNRLVALKLLPPELANDPDRRGRFQREAEIVGRLGEPHIVPVHRYGEIEGRLFLDMQLVDGPDLAAYLVASGPLPPQVAVGIIEQVAAALDAAHAAGLVHGDVKPSNVLVHRPTPGRVPEVMLADFGVAGGTAGAGTIEYLAPERLRGLPGDGRADVYALACVLHELLTGTRAFAGEFAAQVHGHLHLPPPRPSSMIATLPVALDAVVATGMAKDPAARFPTAGVLAAQAKAVLVPAARGPWRPTRRQVLVTAAAGVLTLGGGLAVSSAVRFGQEAPPEPVITERALGIRSDEYPPFLTAAVGGVAMAVVATTNGFQGWDLGADRPVGPSYSRDLVHGIAYRIDELALADVDGKAVLCSMDLGEPAVAVTDLQAGSPWGPPLVPTGAPVAAITAAVIDGTPVVLAVDENHVLARIDLRTSQPLAPPVPQPDISHLDPLKVVELAGRPCLVATDASDSSVITVRDAVTLEVVGRASYLQGVGVLDGAPVAFAPGLGNNLRVVELASGNLRHELPTPGYPIVPVQLDGRLVAAVGAQTGDIVLYDVAAGTRIGAPLTGHVAELTAIETIWLGDRPVLLSAGRDNAIRVWDLAVRAHPG